MGVRVPKNEIACKLASLFPITTTSANLTDEEVLSTPEDILNEISKCIKNGNISFSRNGSYFRFSKSLFKEEFEEKNSWYPYFMNIKKDGIVLYEH